MSEFPPTSYGLPHTTPANLGGGKPGRTSFKRIAIVFFALFAFIGLMALAGRPANGAIPLSEFRRLLLADRFSDITIDGDSVHGTLKAPTMVLARSGMTNISQFQTDLPSGTCNWQFVEWVLDNAGSARVDATANSNFVRQVVLPFVPWVLIFGAVFFFFGRDTRLSAGSKTPPTRVIIVREDEVGK